MANRPAVSLVAVPTTSGRLHLSPLPGRWTPPATPDSITRDLAAIAAAGASVLVSLVEPHELPLSVDAWAAKVAAAGLVWLPLPIADFGVPDAAFEAAWAAADLGARLRRGETVALHCRAGLGRTGMIAARLLVEVAGLTPTAAIAHVRTHHTAKAVETAEQAAHVAMSAARSG